MISVKGGTKTWSDAKQVSSLKSDTTRRHSATEKQEMMGDKAFGEHLNKIADPNWVDPSKMRQVGNPNLDKDAFMKLFLAQLQNQDPMNPLESHEMAAQLAQFTSLEKLDGINEGIAGMNRAQQAPQSFEALNLIGKIVSGDSTKILRTDEEQSHDIEFDLKADAATAVLSIRDMNNQEVKKLEVSGIKEGKNSVYWNGRIDNGTPALAGEYKVVIEAQNSSGGKIQAETAFQGKVTGVNFTAQGPVLMVGNQKIRMNEVKGITVPKAEQQQSNKNVNEVKSVKELKTDRQEDPKVVGMGGNLESVGMSQGLINKLEGQNEN